MRKKFLTVVAAVLLAAGIGFLLFPVISNFVEQQKANSAIKVFDTVIETVIDEDRAEITAKTHEEAVNNGEIDSEGYLLNQSGERVSDAPVVFKADLDRLLADSRAYNESLIDRQGTVDTSDYSTAALNMSDYGLSNIYCCLSAPTIGMSLPVYLGANDEMMSYGAAHLSGTSLPLDEANTNVAIAGHTGYIGRIFFDNLRSLKKGDTVSITNFWETIDYEVIGFKTAKPDQTEDIYIQHDRQLLTLITCIGNNKGGFDRYLVICEKK